MNVIERPHPRGVTSKWTVASGAAFSFFTQAVPRIFLGRISLPSHRRHFFPWKGFESEISTFQPRDLGQLPRLPVPLSSVKPADRSYLVGLWGGWREVRLVKHLNRAWLVTSTAWVSVRRTEVFVRWTPPERARGKASPSRASPPSEPTSQASRTSSLCCSWLLPHGAIGWCFPMVLCPRGSKAALLPSVSVAVRLPPSPPASRSCTHPAGGWCEFAAFSVHPRPCDVTVT